VARRWRVTGELGGGERERRQKKIETNLDLTRPVRIPSKARV
jgi:hypothetical protein